MRILRLCLPILLFANAAIAQDAASLYKSGRAMLEQDESRAKEAADLLEKAVELNPNVSDYQLWYGRALGSYALTRNLLSQGLLAPKVKHAFERAVELDPRSVEAHISMFEFYLNAPAFAGGSKEKAKAEAEGIKRLNPYRGGTIMATLYSRDSNWPAAEQELRTLRGRYPDSVSVGVSLAVMMQTQTQYDRAFAFLDTLTRRHPTNLAVMYQVGRAAAVSGQQLDRGEKALKYFLSKPEDKTLVKHINARFRLGNIYEKQGRKDLARAEYEAVLRELPDHAEARKGLERVGTT